MRLPKIKFILWFVLAVVGQASALRMIQAGNQLRYQHYFPLNRLSEEAPQLALAVFLVQILIVSIGLFNERRTILGWIRNNFSIIAIVGISLVFVITSATVSQNISLYLSELVFAAFVQFINLGNLILLVLAFPSDWKNSLMIKLNGWLGEADQVDSKNSSGNPMITWPAAVWVAVVSAFLALVVYQNHPHVQDEVAYLLHARYLAQNSLVMPAPPIPEAFDFYLMQFDGDQWYPSPPVGWPALLSVGVRMGAPWLVNPLLAGINILLAYDLIKTLYTRRAAAITILLLSISPWYIFMGMNFMTHMFTLTCGLAAALWVIRARETGKARWAAASGLALGVMSLIRPIEALIIAGLLGLWAIGIGGERLKIASVLTLVLTTGAVSFLVLPYNKFLTGNARVFPINKYTDERFGPNSNAYGFGPDRGMGWAIDPNPGHNPIDGLINANLNTTSINVELFGWSVGSLLLVAVFIFSGRYQKSDYMILGVIAVVFTAFFFYYFSGGPDFGARYWFLMIVPLVVLTTRGIETLEGKFSTGRNGQRATVLAGVLLISIIAWINFIPWRSMDKYYHYLGMSPDVLDLAKTYQFHDDLVFVNGENFPDYASAAIYNPVDMYSNSTIYAWEKSVDARDQVIRAYPDRPIWLVEGPSITGNGYRVAAGPLSAKDLIPADALEK